jgi:hypothetical protein
MKKSELRQIIREEIQRLSEGHEIKIDSPKQIKSAKVKKQIQALAKKGVRARDIKARVTFQPDDMQSLVGDFNVVKNTVYFELDTAKFKVGDVVANTTHKSVGIVRALHGRELRTDADGMVGVRELEPFNPKKHKSYHIAPSTKKEAGL